MPHGSDIGLWDILSHVFALVFICWPVVLLSVFRGHGNLLRAAIVLWGLLFLMRIALWFSPAAGTLSSLLIPEPLNTILFFLAGLVLIAVQFGSPLLKSVLPKRKRAPVSDVHDLLSLSPDEFEEMVVALYRGLGYRAQRVGDIGDHGVDIEVRTDKGEKWIVQCKNWRSPVGERHVREFLGAFHHEKADGGAIFGTSGFTSQAQEWAKGKPFHLYDGSDLLRVWRRIQTRKRSGTGQPVAES